MYQALFFFPSRAKEAKKKKKTPDLRLGQLLHFRFEVFSLKKRSSRIRCPSVIIYSNITENAGTNKRRPLR